MPTERRIKAGDKLRRELQDIVRFERGFEALVGQFHAIAFHAGKDDLHRIAVRFDGVNADRRARLCRRGDHRFGGKIERDAEDVGIFDVEKALVV